MGFAKHIEDPEKMSRLKKGSLILLALLVIVDLFVPRDHALFPWDFIPGFHAGYGLLATIVIIVASKFIGHLFLMKREDYYDK